MYKRQLLVDANTTTLSTAAQINNTDGTNSTDTKIGYVGGGSDVVAYGVKSEVNFTSATSVFDSGIGLYGFVKHPSNGTVDLNTIGASSGTYSVNKAVGVGGGLGNASDYIGGPHDIIASVWGATGLHNSGNGSVTGGANL